MARIPGLSRRGFDAFYRKPLLGVDEVGVGCIAGPVYAAGVVLPTNPDLLKLLEDQGLKDSKKMSEYARDRVSKLIHDHAQFVVMESLHPRDVEVMNVYCATSLMFERIISAYWTKWPSPDNQGEVLIDGNHRGPGFAYAHTSVVGGDNRSLSIAAASVVAKVERDRFMKELADYYPGYFWEQNHGYPTPEHLAALTRLGPTDVHRHNTRPVKRVIQGLSLVAASGSSPPRARSERPLRASVRLPGTPPERS